MGLNGPASSHRHRGVADIDRLISVIFMALREPLSDLMKDKVHQDGLTSGGFDPTRVDDRTELKPWFSVSVVLNWVFLRGPCWIHLCSMQTCFPLFSPAALRANSLLIGSRQKAGSNPSQRILGHRVFIRNTSKIRSFLTFTCCYCITLNGCNGPTTNVGLGLLDRSGTCLPSQFHMDPRTKVF